jgi:hypothetical protein
MDGWMQTTTLSSWLGGESNHDFRVSIFLLQFGPAEPSDLLGLSLSPFFFLSLLRKPLVYVTTGRQIFSFHPHNSTNPNSLHHAVGQFALGFGGSRKEKSGSLNPRGAAPSSRGCRVVRANTITMLSQGRGAKGLRACRAP